VNHITLLSVSTQLSVALHLEETANVVEDLNGMPPMKTAWNLSDLSSEGINCQLYRCKEYPSQQVLSASIDPQSMCENMNVQY